MLFFFARKEHLPILSLKSNYIFIKICTLVCKEIVKSLQTESCDNEYERWIFKNNKRMSKLINFFLLKTR